MQRQEILTAIRESVFDPKADPSGMKLFDVAVHGLGKLLAKGDASGVKWYFDQFMGTPRTAVEQVIDNTAIFAALGQILPKHFESDEVSQAVLEGLKEYLADPD